MRPETAASLADIARAGATLAEAVGHCRDDAHYARDAVIQAAVERLFTVIGEALIRVRTLAPSVFSRITDAAQIVGFRGLLDHGYDQVDPVLVWRAATQSHPVLRGEVEALLAQVEAQGL